MIRVLLKLIFDITDRDSEKINIDFPFKHFLIIACENDFEVNVWGIKKEREKSY